MRKKLNFKNIKKVKSRLVKLIFQSISTKFIVSISTVFIIVTVVSIYINYNYDMKKADESLNQKADILAELLSNALIQPIWNFDMLQTEQLGKSLFSDKETYSVVVENMDGEIYNKSVKDQKFNDNNIIIKRDVMKNNEAIGSITLQLTKYYQKEILTYKLNSQIKQSIYIIIVLILVTLIISKIITRPIKFLIEVTEKISSGNLEARANIKSNDEISELASKFNLMANKLKDTINLIQKYAIEISKGNLTAVVKENNDSNLVTTYMKNIAETINRINEEVYSITEEVVNGNLNKRLDVSKYSGEYKKIIIGMNNTLDAVVNPIIEVNNVLGEVSIGNLSVSAIGKYNGEFKKLTSNLNITIKTLNDYIGDISYVLKELSSKNLDLKIKDNYKGDFKVIGDSLETITEAFNRTFYEINISTEVIANSSIELSESSKKLSEGTTNQASAITELNQEVGSVTEMTNKNADKSKESNKSAKNVLSRISDGGTKINDMSKKIDEVFESSKGIYKIVNVINEIAFQTNILAVNASIEAARAGIYGKGFSVVAIEVRNLAIKCAEAANETTEMIEKSIKRSEESSEMAFETAESLNYILSEVSKIFTIFDEITTASTQQAKSISEIKIGLNQISGVVENNNVAAEKNADTSIELSENSKKLEGLVSQFNLIKNKTTKNRDTKKITASIDIGKY